MIAPTPIHVASVLSWLLDEGWISDADSENPAAVGAAVGRVLRNLAAARRAR